jgi:hypothetical protein
MKGTSLASHIRKLLHMLAGLLPTRAGLVDGLRTFAMILGGALLLAPLVDLLPMLGFDWYYFFNAGNPIHSLSSPLSTYPPFANVILSLLTWMPWRDSLAILNAITLVSVAIGTWKQGGRVGSVLLAILNAPVLFLLWIGHPDALALSGVLTGFIPLILVKPPVAIWSILASRKLVFWTAVILLVSLVAWPLWFLNMAQATSLSVPAFGWPVFGWPLAVVGVLLLAGAGDNPYRLMAAGTFLTPYLLPYHLAVLAPGIGSARGWRKLVAWLAAWLVAVGTGLGRPYSILCFAFPLAIYFGSYSPREVYRAIEMQVSRAARLARRLRWRKASSSRMAAN